MTKTGIRGVAILIAVACGIVFSGAATAQEKITIWWVKGFYKSEDAALFAAIKKFEDKTGDDTRSISATCPFVSRFMPATRPSRFSSRRIPRCSRRNVGASPFSTFPATCLAKPPPQRLDVPRTPSCILGVTSDFAARAEFKSAVSGSRESLA